MRAASEHDKRYLLFNPIMKMKVALQGEETLEMLFDIIAAKGFEKDTYFEQAVIEIRGYPKLEGTRHVNMALIAKLIPNYFFNPGSFPEVGRRNGGENDDFLFRQGPTKGYGKVQFHDYNIAYSTRNLPNVNVFREQIEAFKGFLIASGAGLAGQMMDFDYLLAVGELFTLVAYGQLIIESANMEKVDDAVLNQMFDVYVRDFSRYAMTLASKPSNSPEQRSACEKAYRYPVANPDEYEKVISGHVYSLIDAYIQNP